MKRHISIFKFLVCAFAACSLAQRAYSVDLVIIADEKMSVSYFINEQLHGSYTLTNPVSWPEAYYYWQIPLQPTHILTVESRPGKTFGWYTLAQKDTDTAGSNTSVSQCTVLLSEERQITAETIKTAKTSVRFGSGYVICPKYTNMPLTVTFKGNGATSGSTSDMRGLDIDSKFNLSANGYAKTGYSFGGWSNRVERTFLDKARVSGEDFWATDHFESTLYAIWNETSYEITCDPEGAGPASATFEEVFSVPDVTKTGYEFKGWKVEGADFSTARYGSSEGSVNTSLTAATVCRGADGKTWFRRLNSTGGSVRLVAQFEAKTYTVDFVNMGGTGGPTSMSVTYDGVLKDVSNVPTKDGNTFMGYDIEGVRYWGANGLSQKEKWDIPSDCTAYAQWEAKTFYIEYDANGGSGTIPSLFCTNGVGTTLSDGAAFSRPGCTLLGWSTSPSASKPEYVLGETRTFSFTANTKLYAIWEVSYYIGFNGFGATSGTMEPQNFKQDERKELKRNGYKKTGYSFAGWAKDEAGARALKSDYEDGELFTGKVGVPGSTNWLYAVWNTNAYHVAFSANGGTGTLPKTIDCLYDHPVTIPAPSADLVKPPFLFSGWRDSIADVVYTNLPAVVSNLCAVADGTNTLFAVWKLSDLSEAMHCTNLVWESVTNANHSSRIGWTGVYGEDEGFEGSGSCAHQSALSEGGIPQMLTAKLEESGTLSFRWKGTRVRFEISEFRDQNTATPKTLTAPSAGEWNFFSTNLVVMTETWVHIYNYTPDSAADIDQMTWTPEGAHPEPGTVVTNAMPVAITGLVYNGSERIGVEEGDGYTIVGNVATNAGEYTAVATPNDGFVWEGGSSDPANIAWTIAKATVDMGGVTLTNGTYEADGTAKSIFISGTLPPGVTVAYEGNGQTEPGTYTVTAKFAGDAKNYEAIPDKTATLTLLEPFTGQYTIHFKVPDELEKPGDMNCVTGKVYNLPALPSEYKWRRTDAGGRLYDGGVLVFDLIEAPVLELEAVKVP